MNEVPLTTEHMKNIDNKIKQTKIKKHKAILGITKVSLTIYRWQNYVTTHNFTTSQFTSHKEKALLCVNFMG